MKTVENGVTAKQADKIIEMWARERGRRIECVGTKIKYNSAGEKLTYTYARTTDKEEIAVRVKEVI